jgi:hypothetical protein
MGLFSRRKSGDDNRPPAQGAGNFTPDANGGEPFSGYDRLDSRKLMAGLHGYSQAELTAIEEYERSHQDRVEVLHKLRYMRGAEPIEGYDDLSPDQVIASLGDSDINTIKRIRDYERKFANRKEVIDAVTAAAHADRAARPVEKPPAYQAGGGSHDSI